MGKKIVIMGTADTKGEQLQLLKETISARGHQAILMDMGMGGKPKVETDVIAEEIAGLAGKDLKDLMASKDRFAVTEAMTAGALQKALDLLSQRNHEDLGALLLESDRCRPGADQLGKVRFLRKGSEVEVSATRTRRRSFLENVLPGRGCIFAPKNTSSVN